MAKDNYYKEDSEHQRGYAGDYAAPYVFFKATFEKQPYLTYHTFKQILHKHIQTYNKLMRASQMQMRRKILLLF